MRLADDDRARVPFALVGALLLVSATVAATVQPSDGHVERHGAEAAERAEAVAQTVLRDAAKQAGAEAAAAPVIEPANTTMGRALDEERPFRSHLELLTYLRALERFEEVDERAGTARAGVELPPVTNASTARAAIERTTVEAAGTGVVRVEIENATTIVESGFRTVDERDLTLEVHVETPVLTLHDRAAEFQRRVTSGALAGPGFGRELTGRLYALAWARGYAQYAGAPVETVVGNRHVEVLANGALLDVQRSTFGRADADAERGLARATTRLAGEELGVEGLSAAAVPEPNEDPEGRRSISSPDADPEPVRIGRTAGRGLEDLLDGEGGRSLETLLEDAHAIEARLAVETETVDRTTVSEEELPGPEWHLVDARLRENPVEVSRGPAPLPGPEGDWRRAESFGRIVTVERTVYREWVRGAERRVTEEVVHERRAVGVTVLDRPAPLPGVTERPIRSFDRGDVSDDPVLRRADERAVNVLVGDRGGRDAVASRAALGDHDNGSVELRLAPSEGAKQRVYRDLSSLRDDVRAISVEVERPAIATDANPAADLAGVLEERRADLVDAPAAYANLTDRARVAARAAYVDRTVRRLEDRGSDIDAIQGHLGSELVRIGARPRRAIDDLLAVGFDHARPDPRPIAADPPAGDLRVEVETSPQYLSLRAVDDLEPWTEPPTDANESYHPLAARTATVGSLPIESVVDRAVSHVLDDAERVPLPVAARVLRNARAVPDSLLSERALRQRTELREAVAASVDAAAADAVVGLRPVGLSASERRDAVEAGLERWDTPAERALAIHNGSAAEAVATAAARSADRDSQVVRIRAELRTRSAFEDAIAREDVRVPLEPVDGVANATREAVSDLAVEAVDRLKDRARDRVPARAAIVPSGTPIVPYPGTWWATANAWSVRVEGTYASFTARANVGGPTGGGQVSYVRDGSTVAVDLTGDGTEERLGTATRIEVAASTYVVVVVPPGRTGVGNVGGDRVQCSDGWPEACSDDG